MLSNSVIINLNILINIFFIKFFNTSIFTIRSQTRIQAGIEAGEMNNKLYELITEYLKKCMKEIDNIK